MLFLRNKIREKRFRKKLELFYSRNAECSCRVMICVNQYPLLYYCTVRIIVQTVEREEFY